jgi:hypothetical protein
VYEIQRRNFAYGESGSARSTSKNVVRLRAAANGGGSGGGAARGPGVVLCML